MTIYFTSNDWFQIGIFLTPTEPNSSCSPHRCYLQRKKPSSDVKVSSPVFHLQTLMFSSFQPLSLCSLSPRNDSFFLQFLLSCQGFHYCLFVFLNFYFAVLCMNLSVLKVSVWFLSIDSMLTGTRWYPVSDTHGIRSLWMLAVPAFLIEYIIGFIQLWLVCPFCIINSTYSHIKRSTPKHIFNLWSFTKYLWKVFDVDIAFLWKSWMLKDHAQSTRSEGINTLLFHCPDFVSVIV